MTGTDPAVLILGSFPSLMSLGSGQYYANPKNQFWMIMESLFGIDHTLPYRTRTRLLTKNRIALWDAIRSCERTGSADSRIKNPACNDIGGLLASCPTIRLIACNGSASAGYVSLVDIPDTITVLRLPSTSPANAALSLEDKIARWSVLLSDNQKGIPRCEV